MNSIENLNTMHMIPRKDIQSNRLVTGALQLASGTELVLDETALLEGKLEPNGINNLKALGNMLQHQRSIVNAMAVNDDGVMATGADNGQLWLWDWNSGNRFQEMETQAQPGSLDSENVIFAMSFDVTGTRLLTCEADKTIKFYKEDLEATPETHPVRFKPPTNIRRY